MVTRKHDTHAALSKGTHYRASSEDMTGKTPDGRHPLP